MAAAKSSTPSSRTPSVSPFYAALGQITGEMPYRADPREKIPLAPFREEWARLQAEHAAREQEAQRAGLGGQRSKNGKAIRVTPPLTVQDVANRMERDRERVRRLLVAPKCGGRKTKVLATGEKRTYVVPPQQVVTYDVGIRLARALDMVPVELGV